MDNLVIQIEVSTEASNLLSLKYGHGEGDDADRLESAVGENYMPKKG